MLYSRFAMVVIALIACCVAQARSGQPRTKPASVKNGIALARLSGSKPDFPSPPTLNSWVWLSQNPQEPNAAVACFRKSVLLDANPEHVAAWISADRHYRLYINGDLVSRGPTDPGEDYPGGKSKGNTGLYYCDYRDLTPYFHKGKNVIAVEVFAARLSEWYGSSGHPGLFFAARLAHSDRSVVEIKADPTWRAITGEYFEIGQDGLRYLPAKEPARWRLSDFDDSRWAHCATIGSHWPNLQTSQIPPMMEISFPALRAVRTSPGIEVSAHPFQDGRSVTIRSDGSFALQYERIVSAYVRLKIKGGAGAQLHIALNETNNPGGHRSATIELTRGTQYFETPFYSSFTFLNVTATNVTTPIEIEAITARFVSYPVSYRGTFACSDDFLNRLWLASRWATQICMQDHYLDSPDHQEPICDPGDYMIEALLSDYAFGESGLTRQELRKFGALLVTNDYINFHTSYSLLWLQMLVNYFDYTGDAALVRELSPQVFGLLDRFATWRGKNGLISEAPDYMFMDWVSIAGIPCHHPPAVIGQGYMTAFYYRALADARRVAQVVGAKTRAKSYAKLRPEIVRAFNRELWSSEKGLYRDGKPFQTAVRPGNWLPADTAIETFSPHVNFLAALYDLAPQNRRATILKQVMAQRPLNCQPYFYHYVLDALHHSGLFEEYAPAEMRRWQIHSETQSFQEMWESGDWSHAWGGTPLYQLSSKVLGVTPGKPGFQSISIRPVLCDLQWAKGRIPTPHGNVDVSWKRTREGITLSVTIPQGTDADLVLPLQHFKNPKITWDGQASLRKSSASIEPGTVHFKGGSYRFSVTETRRGGNNRVGNASAEGE